MFSYLLHIPDMDVQAERIKRVWTLLGSGPGNHSCFPYILVCAGS